VVFIEQIGLSVVSDIDDTIKISNVADKKAFMKSLLVSNFEAVAGMEQLYAEWEKKYCARFHYVSGSPWQLWEPLANFLEEKGFPQGTAHLRKFKVTDKSIYSGAQQKKEMTRRKKLRHIEPLLLRFPKRKFVFVGDSGEEDPEIYSDLGRRYSNQVVAIFIRRTPLPDTLLKKRIPELKKRAKKRARRNVANSDDRSKKKNTKTRSVPVNMMKQKGNHGRAISLDVHVPKFSIGKCEQSKPETDTPRHHYVEDLQRRSSYEYESNSQKEQQRGKYGFRTMKKKTSSFFLRYSLAEGEKGQEMEGEMRRETGERGEGEERGERYLYSADDIFRFRSPLSSSSSSPSYSYSRTPLSNLFFDPPSSSSFQQLADSDSKKSTFPPRLQDLPGDSESIYEELEKGAGAIFRSVTLECMKGELESESEKEEFSLEISTNEDEHAPPDIPNTLELAPSTEQYISQNQTKPLETTTEHNLQNISNNDGGREVKKPVKEMGEGILEHIKENKSLHDTQDVTAGKKSVEERKGKEKGRKEEGGVRRESGNNKASPLISHLFPKDKKSSSPFSLLKKENKDSQELEKWRKIFEEEQREAEEERWKQLFGDLTGIPCIIFDHPNEIISFPLNHYLPENFFTHPNDDVKRENNPPRQITNQLQNKNYIYFTD